MKILSYTSCYGGYFKDKLISNSIQSFDIIYWYDTPIDMINIETYKDYDVLICEYVPKRANYYSSEEFIKAVRPLNPNINVVVYPLVVLNIFPFYKHAFGFLSSHAIDKLLGTGLSNDTILELYSSDKIKFNPLEGLHTSLNKLKEIEQKCDIKVSSIIETYYSDPIYVDALFPSDRVMNAILEQILGITGIDAKINYGFIENDITRIHKLSSVFTDEMISELNIKSISSTPNYKEYYLPLLIEYLSSKGGSIT